jgi:predicted Ser/Thr protein kinase
MSVDDVHDAVDEPNADEGSAEAPAPQKKKRRTKAERSASGAKRQDLNGYARYRIDRELGRGSMGIVHLAHDLVEDRDVAIKELALASAQADGQRAEMIERFEREAGAAAALDSPNVVKVLDSFAEGDRRFIVMEYLDGETLDALIKRGPLPPEAAAGVAEQILQGLEAAHSAGTVHRDLKPSNIFVMSDGLVKVADFGVARIDETDTGLTQAGQVLGTLGYMSPEQVRGEQVDARADIFAVGVVLYEMLVGANPFGAEQPTTVMYRIAYEEPPSLEPFVACLPAHMGAVITKAIAKDPALRYQTATEMLSDLRNGVAPDTKAIVAAAAKRAAQQEKQRKKANAKPRFRLKLSRQAWIAAAVVGVVLLAGAGVGYGYLRQRQEAEAVKRAAIARSAVDVTATIGRVKALRTRFDTVMTVLRSKSSANRAALAKWDKTWKARQDSYNARYAAVERHNQAEDAAYAASVVTRWDYWLGWITTYTYVKKYSTYPNYPSQPGKVKVDLAPEAAAFAKLASDVAVLKSTLSSSTAPAGYFPVVNARIVDALTAFGTAVDSAESSLPGLVTTDESKGDMLNATAISSIGTAEADAAIGKIDSEFDLYLGNYGLSRAALTSAQ